MSIQSKYDPKWGYLLSITKRFDIILEKVSFFLKMGDFDSLEADTAVLAQPSKTTLFSMFSAGHSRLQYYIWEPPPRL